MLWAVGFYFIKIWYQILFIKMGARFINNTNLFIARSILIWMEYSMQ